MAKSKGTQHTPVVKKPPRKEPGFHPPAYDLHHAVAGRAIAFWRARVDFEQVRDGTSRAAHAAELLEVLHCGVRLLRHEIAYGRDRARLGRNELRRSLEELRIAEFQATTAGAPPIRGLMVGDGDQLADAAPAYWLDAFASEAQIDLPQGLRGSYAGEG